MDRRTFLTTMLQGTLAATMLPHSISPLLIAQYASQHHLGEIHQQSMKIAALGIGRFGILCSRLLAYSVHNIICHEVPSNRRHASSVDFSQLPQSIQQADLLFLIADTSELSSAYLLTICIDRAASTGQQAVMVGPHATTLHSALSLRYSPPPACTVAETVMARNLVALVADLVNIDNFVGIDQADVKEIMCSGSRGLFAYSEATGTNRGAKACLQALEQLQHLGLNSANCRSAMACIYGSPNLHLDDYHQAITNLDNQFSPEINFVFGAVTDERLADSVRVAILAMQ